MRESVSALKSVLFPTLGRPTMPQRSAMVGRDVSRRLAEREAALDALHARGVLAELALQALAVESQLSRGAADVAVALGEHPLDVLALAPGERLARVGRGLLRAQRLAAEDLQEGLGG